MIQCFVLKNTYQLTKYKELWIIISMILILSIADNFTRDRFGICYILFIAHSIKKDVIVKGNMISLQKTH